MTNKAIEEMLAYNRRFVESRAYEAYKTDKYPDKKTAIITCMDTRLTTLLPAALGLKNGDVKLIKIAGGLVNTPFDSAMRSLLIAIYELGVTDVMVIAHTDCGAQHMDAGEMLAAMTARGISRETIDTIGRCGIDLMQWFKGFGDTGAAVIRAVSLIRHHPLIPADVTVTGYVIDTATGMLTPVGRQDEKPGPDIVHDTAGRRFTTTVDGHTAHVAYDLHDGALDIRHTIVPTEIGGRGIASTLVRAAYDYATAEGLRPMATCSYAARWLDRHPEYHGCTGSDFAEGSCAI